MKNTGERFLASARNDNACHLEPFGCSQDKLRERSFSIPFFKGNAKDTKFGVAYEFFRDLRPIPVVRITSLLTHSTSSLDPFPVTGTASFDSKHAYPGLSPSKGKEFEQNALISAVFIVCGRKIMNHFVVSPVFPPSTLAKKFQMK
jgi:hypothetical protein